MKRNKMKRANKTPISNTEHEYSESMINLLISLNAFPIESDEELEEQKRIIEELKKLNNNKK
jgi:beta-lactamase regulating signal transducer with metallopeptidase domain